MEVTPQTCCNQIEVQTWFSSYRLVLTQAISPQQCSLTVNWIVHNFIMWTVKIAARDLTTATWVSFSKLCTDSFLNAVSLFTVGTLTSGSAEEMVNKMHKEDGNWNVTSTHDNFVPIIHRQAPLQRHWISNGRLCAFSQLDI